MYETRTNDGTVELWLGSVLVSRISAAPRRKYGPVYLAEGLAFPGISPEYRTPTEAVLWAMERHRGATQVCGWCNDSGWRQTGLGRMRCTCQSGGHRG